LRINIGQGGTYPFVSKRSTSKNPKRDRVNGLGSPKSNKKKSIEPNYGLNNC